MNSTKNRISLAKARAQIASDIAAVDAAIRAVATSGFASASLSSGGGSKSYTRTDLAQLRALRADLVSRLAAVSARLAGRGSFSVRHLVTVRS